VPIQLIVCVVIYFGQHVLGCGQCMAGASDPSSARVISTHDRLIYHARRKNAKSLHPFCHGPISSSGTSATEVGHQGLDEAPPARPTRRRGGLAAAKRRCTPRPGWRRMGVARGGATNIFYLIPPIIYGAGFSGETWEGGAGEAQGRQRPMHAAGHYPAPTKIRSQPKKPACNFTQILRGSGFREF